MGLSGLRVFRVSRTDLKFSFGSRAFRVWGCLCQRVSSFYGSQGLKGLGLSGFLSLGLLRIYSGFMI